VLRIDLHSHSTCSDGTESPEAVAARAADRAVAIFALTDHDTCAGTGLPVTNARSLRAVELSCSDDTGRTVHILAYDRGGTGPGGGDWAVLEHRLAAVRVARVNRMRVMAARLEQRGIRIDVTPLLAAADLRSIGRPDLARAMVAAGAATSIKDAFARHLYDGGPVDVPHRNLSLDEAIALGRDIGAALSLAHPHLYDDRSAGILDRYRGRGLTGIEAFHGAYDARERSRWLALADRLALTCTGGSDWHGPDDALAPMGVDLPDDRGDALLRWLDRPS